MSHPVPDLIVGRGFAPAGPRIRESATTTAATSTTGGHAPDEPTRRFNGHQPRVCAPPLNGPLTSGVIQPP